MKHFKYFIILFLFLGTYVYPQNYSCKPYFYIPNNFIEFGTDFGKKLKIKNLGALVNSKSLEYAPIVSLDGKKLYFVSDREGSKITTESRNLSTKNQSFSKEQLSIGKDEYGDEVFTTSKENFQLLLLSLSKNNISKNQEGIIFNGKEIVYMIANLSKKRLSDYGMDLSNIKTKEENNLYFIENQNLDYFKNNYLSHVKNLHKVIIEIKNTGYNPALVKNYFIIDSGQTIFPDTDEKSDNKKYSHDFWFSEINYDYDLELSHPVNLDEDSISFINTNMNEGAASFSSDGKKIYFTKCNINGDADDCDIYVSEIINGKWSRPVNLGSQVNTKYWDAQPSISSNNNTLYFISNRPMNINEKLSKPDKSYKGNINIWYSEYQESSGKWLEAKPLNAINTPGKEYCPFIAADNKTLFFASDSIKPNYGKLDFYVTRYDSLKNTWSVPFNLGMPINSELDDAFLTIPAGGDVIYFSSNRKDVPNYQGKLDLFMAELPDESAQCLNLNLMTMNPNPFYEQTILTINLDKFDAISILLFDVTGSFIKKIFEGSLSPGSYQYTWDGKDNLGNPLPSGAYYVNLILGKNYNNYTERKCVVLSK